MRLVRLLSVAMGATLAFLLGLPAFAQVVDASRAHPPRIYNTHRLTGKPPSIDGHLDDEAWKEGEWAGDYTQQLPVEGGAPSQKTELKILYDEKNIYFAIRAYDDMGRVARYSSRRDEIAGDIVGVCFDSFFDKRTGFEFDITSAGTKIDLVLSNEGWDTTWDAVWDGKVAYELNAWTAEFRIPLSQLRYGPQDAQIWGMHAWRWIDRFQEESQWNLIPRQGSGRLYNFGELHGIHGLKPRRRVELLPHVLEPSRVAARADRQSVRREANGTGAVGLDAKVGLASNFTMDATVNPDFGQVEADPSVVNLTTYETFYEEKRPFFLEGKRIFTLGLPGSAIAGDESGTLQGDQLFYSRRIGAPPTIEPVIQDGAFLEAPGQTSIISAVKVTGKTKDGLSVGLLQSVTGNEHANLWFNGLESRVTVAPTTNYVVGRVQKDWDKGQLDPRRHVHVDASLAARRGGRAPFTDGRFHGRGRRDPLLRRSLRTSSKAKACSAASPVIPALLALQTNPVHYYQRPDASHLGVDPNATSMLGHAGTVRVARYGKSKWLWSESARWMSPGLDLNDVGFLRQADVILNEARLEFKEIEPRGVFRSYGFSITRDDIWDFGGLKTLGSTGFLANGAFRNLWTVSAGLNVLEAPTDTRLLRGGPAMTTSGRIAAIAGVNSDPSRRLNVQVTTERDFVLDGGGRRANVTAQVNMRPANAFYLSVIGYYERNVDDLQYVDTAHPEGSPGTCWAGSIRTHSV